MEIYPDYVLFVSSEVAIMGYKIPAISEVSYLGRYPCLPKKIKLEQFPVINNDIIYVSKIEIEKVRTTSNAHPIVFSPTSDPGTLLVIGKTKGLNSDGDRFNNHGVLLKFGYTVPTEGILFRQWQTQPEWLLDLKRNSLAMISLAWPQFICV